MKKLMAFVLVLMVGLNAAVLLWGGKTKTEENARPTALKMPGIELKEIKPGILPGLLKF